MPSFYPGLNGMRINLIWQQNGWNSSSNLAAAQELQLSDQSDITDILSGFEIDLDGNDILPFVLIGAALLAAAALPLTVLVRRELMLKKYGRSGCRVLFDRLIGSLHFGGVLTDMDGSEEGFAACLAEVVDGLSAEETQGFVEAVSRAAFGNVAESEDERRLAGTVYGRTADFVYKGLGLPKRLFFKYIKVYI